MATSTEAVLRSRFPRGYAGLNKLFGAPARFLDGVGKLAWFTAQALAEIPHALRYYRKEVLRLIAETGTRTGAIPGIAATVATVSFAPPPPPDTPPPPPASDQPAA